jgi:hypothetical protein
VASTIISAAWAASNPFPLWASTAVINAPKRLPQAA